MPATCAPVDRVHATPELAIRVAFAPLRDRGCLGKLLQQINFNELEHV